MKIFARTVLAVLLLISSSLAVTAMAAPGPHEHMAHEHGAPAMDHDGADCSAALCCFALEPSEVVGPSGCSPSVPKPSAGELRLPMHTDPQERPPQASWRGTHERAEIAMHIERI
ncbi:hypothetical protein [Pelagibacterium mangrovi]|uniref:hypothetical protein n=1 Tax=Pelagibacterium mangrovi TaxID=3119828 RepID=UPI002FCAA966